MPCNIRQHISVRNGRLPREGYMLKRKKWHCTKGRAAWVTAHAVPPLFPTSTRCKKITHGSDRRARDEAKASRSQTWQTGCADEPRLQEDAEKPRAALISFKELFKTMIMFSELKLIYHA